MKKTALHISLAIIIFSIFFIPFYLIATSQSDITINSAEGKIDVCEVKNISSKLFDSDLRIIVKLAKENSRYFHLDEPDDHVILLSELCKNKPYVKIYFSDENEIEEVLDKEKNKVILSLEDRLKFKDDKKKNAYIFFLIVISFLSASIVYIIYIIAFSFVKEKQKPAYFFKQYFNFNIENLKLKHIKDRYEKLATYKKINYFLIFVFIFMILLNNLECNCFLNTFFDNKDISDLIIAVLFLAVYLSNFIAFIKKNKQELNDEEIGGMFMSTAILAILIFFILAKFILLFY